jgi:hypothetical protein
MQQCRFCLSEDEKENLISPCSCKGTFEHVHSDCLTQWYNAEPARGLKCGVCQEWLAVQYDNPVETIPLTPFFRYLYEQNTVFFVALYHAGYILGLPLIIQFPRSFIYNQYYLFQIVVHCVYLFFLALLFFHVQDKRRYLSYWKNARGSLVVIHGILYLAIQSYFVFAGITADVFLHMIFKEHFRVLNLMNGKKEFRFVNRD